MTVNEYDIELRMTNKPTGDSEIVVTREPAYALMEAWQQAIMNVGAQARTRGWDPDIQVLHVGPARDVVDASRAQASESIAAAVIAAIRCGGRTSTALTAALASVAAPTPPKERKA